LLLPNGVHFLAFPRAPGRVTRLNPKLENPGIARTKMWRVTLSSRMWCLRSEFESSAGFQPAVSQVFNLQAVRTIASDPIALNRANLDYCSSGTRQTPKNHGAHEELKPFGCNLRRPKRNPKETEKADTAVPDDFMLQLTIKASKALKCRIGIFKRLWALQIRFER